MIGRKKGSATYRGRLATLKSSDSDPLNSLSVCEDLHLLEYDQDVLTYENNSLEVHHTPVWKRPLSLYGTNRWIVFSPKLRRTVILYNNLEYDHWALVESEPAIKSYCEQPRRIRVRLPSGVVTTVFDMWILWNSQLQEYRAVRYMKDLSRPNVSSRVNKELKAQKLWCQLGGVRHSVVTDETVRANPTYLVNWKLILSHLAVTQNIDLKYQTIEILAMLTSEGSRQLRQIEASFPNKDRSLTRSAIFALLHSGRLRAPLERMPLTASLPVEIAQ